MEKYKYTHIFLVRESKLKFSPNILRMFSREKCFDINEHLFVVPYYDAYCELCRIIDDEDLKEINIVYYHNPSWYKAKVINKYSSVSKWIILHGSISPKQSVFIDPKYCKKIIWRTWGSDFWKDKIDQSGLRKFVQNIIKQIWKNRVKSFCMIGIANTADIVNINHILGQGIKTMIIPYPMNMKLLQGKIQSPQRDDNDSLNILLGHSGYASERHIEIIKKFGPYKNENIHFYIPLAYGNADYINDICPKINELCKNNCTIIRDMIPYEEYNQFLSKMDIGVFSGTGSYALGNIAQMISLQKTLFVADDGVIRQAFDIDHIPYRVIDEIGKLSFEELKKPLIFDSANKTWRVHTYEEQIEMWQKFLEELN